MWCARSDCRSHRGRCYPAALCGSPGQPCPGRSPNLLQCRPNTEDRGWSAAAGAGAAVRRPRPRRRTHLPVHARGRCRHLGVPLSSNQRDVDAAHAHVFQHWCTFVAAAVGAGVQLPGSSCWQLLVAPRVPGDAIFALIVTTFDVCDRGVIFLFAGLYRGSIVVGLIAAACRCVSAGWDCGA